MARQTNVAVPKRGEVYLVDFDPTVGAELQKTRPVVILQNDIGNRFSPTTIVAGITSRVGDRLYPTEVIIAPTEGGLGRQSVLLLNQIRSIDRARLVKRLGRLRRETMFKVDRALQISLGLVEF